MSYYIDFDTNPIYKNDMSETYVSKISQLHSQIFLYTSHNEHPNLNLNTTWYFEIS